jgi:hypothetical protein
MALIARKFILRSNLVAVFDSLSFKSLFFGGLTVITPLSFIECESNTLCDIPKNKFGCLNKVHTFAHMSNYSEHSKGTAIGCVGAAIILFVVIVVIALIKSW